MTFFYPFDRIRNLEDKISELSPDGQVVKGITDHFCQTKISHLQNDLEAEKEKVRVYLAVISVWKSPFRMHSRAPPSTRT